jgi:hypothetical protein
MIAPSGWMGLLCGFVLAGLLLGTSACHSEIRFDDHSIDAGGTQPAPDVAADVVPPLDVTPAVDALIPPPACAELRCGYEGETCNAASCDLECPQRAQCSGQCGPHCIADCEEDSHCSLATGSDARIRCEPGARCLLTLGSASEGRCEAGSRCNIVCLSACALLCDKGATCAFACSESGALVPFAGHASCPQ